MDKDNKLKIKDLKPKMKIWLSISDDVNFGDGRCLLLEAIKDNLSLKKAAEKLNMSYRKAWGDLKKTEDLLGIKLIEKQRGGATGGETRLTEYGELWLSSFQKLRSDVDAELEKAFQHHFARIIDG